jgi:hypothetical protein
MVQSATWRKLAAMFAVVAAVGFSATVGAADEAADGAPPAKIEIVPFGGGGGGIEGGGIEGGGGIEIEGGFGGIEGIGLPKEFAEMMKSAQQMAELQAKYQASVDELIAAAKDLEKAENLMDSVTKVAKLAKESEAIKAEMTKKQEEMTKKIGAGAIGIGGFGIGGPIEGGAFKILPGAPAIKIEVDGIEIGAPEAGE